MEHMELFIPSATAPRARRRSREVRHYDLPGMAILSHGIVLGKRITAFNCLYSAGRGHCRPDRDAGVSRRRYGRDGFVEPTHACCFAVNWRPHPPPLRAGTRATHRPKRNSELHAAPRAQRRSSGNAAGTGGSGTVLAAVVSGCYAPLASDCCSTMHGVRPQKTPPDRGGVSCRNIAARDLPS